MMLIGGVRARRGEQRAARTDARIERGNGRCIESDRSRVGSVATVCVLQCMWADAIVSILQRYLGWLAGLGDGPLVYYPM
jgi:hypothetical protein